MNKLVIVGVFVACAIVGFISFTSKQSADFVGPDPLGVHQTIADFVGPDPGATPIKTV